MSGRSCAVCGRNISQRDICNECFREWGNGGEYPEWLGEIIKIHHNFEVTKASEEISFTDDGRDLFGYKVHDMGTNLP